MEKGESLASLLSGPPTLALAHLDNDEQGFAWIPGERLRGPLRGNADPIKAKVMCAVEQPFFNTAFGTVMGVPVRKSLPLWFVATNDEATPAHGERQFAMRMGRHDRRSAAESPAHGFASR